jgi:hypothetical protein
MTVHEYTQLNWHGLAKECLAKHNPDTMPEFWLLTGIFAMEMGKQQVPEVMTVILNHAFALRDTAIVALLTRMVAFGSIRRALVDGN